VTSAVDSPPNARNNYDRTGYVFILTEREVMNAQVLKDSGDALFDQRAVDAVYLGKTNWKSWQQWLYIFLKEIIRSDRFNF